MAIASWGKRAALGMLAILLLSGAFGAGFFRGHSMGFASAENKGRAALAEFREATTAAQNAALQETNNRLRQETEKALKAGADYAQEKERHENTRKTLEKRIASLGGRGTVRLDPEIVRLLNEAIGAACADGEGKDSDPAGTYDAPRPGNAPCAGFRPGKVTNRDLARFIIYYGTRSQKMEAQLNALITRIEEYNR